MKKTTLLTYLLLPASLLFAQPDRWQQSAEYKMNIDFNVDNHQFTGTQSLRYFNNSPDTLDKVFYHLYFNAFQLESMMDVRSRIISDPDPRVGDRINALSEDEIGYLRPGSLKMNGKAVAFEIVGTILEVQLTEPILPGTVTVFEMEFEGQVPLQIRRSGRFNEEGVDYSMAQWYPKMCEYDYQGWHANPYVGREFYGIWGDFDVTINIDKEYVVAATGYLQNPNQIGYGYEQAGASVDRPSGDKLSWRFKAEDVHDFVWAADPDYQQIVLERDNGNVLRFFYIPGERTTDNWEMLPGIMDRAFDFINKNYGQYPYKGYSFIQGGDGGMEYPMATLITGERSLGSLVGVSVHELMHSWYQMLLGTNEALYAWMDEGFTSFATNEVMNYLRSEKLIPGDYNDLPHLRSYAGYLALARTDMEEPLSTHADHFETNRAYGTGSYSKGAVFLAQLEYVLGEQDFRAGLLRYFNTWKFKHPNANDFIRVMEKESGLELDWYKEYFVNSTHNIDYAIVSVEQAGEEASISLERTGLMPMPIDVLITFEDGSSKMYSIPLRIMRGAKPAPKGMEDAYEEAEDWPWTNLSYRLQVKTDGKVISKVEIDPSKLLADVDQRDNVWGDN